jgi:hypothetical protein
MLRLLPQAVLRTSDLSRNRQLDGNDPAPHPQVSLNRHRILRGTRLRGEACPCMVKNDATEYQCVDRCDGN